MIAGRPPGRSFAVGPVIGESPASPVPVLGRWLAVGGVLLLIAAVNLALYAAIGGARVPPGQPYRWEGAGPVYVTARSGGTSCAVEGGGRIAVDGYDLVMGSVMGGRTVSGQPARRSANDLVCDRAVSVTSGWIVQVYPLAGSRLRFAAYFLAILAGAALARPPERRPKVADALGGERTAPADGRWRPEPQRRRSGARWPHEWWTNADRASLGTRPSSRPRSATNPPPQRPGWASANVKADQSRAVAGVEPMLFARMTLRQRQVVADGAGLMSFVAGLGVAPLLALTFGRLPPDYVTYPLIVAVILGSYALVSRKLHASALGRPWHPHPQAGARHRPSTTSNNQKPEDRGPVA